MSSPVDNTLDPFSQAYELQKYLAFNNKLVTKLVKPSNAMLFTGGLQKAALPLKKEIGPGDLPELRILAMGGTPRVGRDSDHTSWLQKFDWQIATGNLDIEAVFFPLTLAILACWASWQPLFSELTWQGAPFVHLAQAIETTQGIAIENENRGIQGWASVWSVQVDIWLSTAQLKALNTIQ